MKKKINVILIVLVLGLWGTIGYRYINNYFSDSDISLEGVNVDKQLDLIIKRDTFLLEPIRRDPFLNSSLKPETQRRTSSPMHKAVTAAAPENIRGESFTMPEIVYYGFIKSGNNEERAIVKVNGTILRVKKGQKLQNILIKSFSKKSVEVVCNESELSFDKTN